MNLVPCRSRPRQLLTIVALMVVIPATAGSAAGSFVTAGASLAGQSAAVHAAEEDPCLRATDAVGLELSHETVMAGEEVSITGTGLEPLSGRYGIAVGDELLHWKAITAWEDEEIRFNVEVLKPGLYEVALESVEGIRLPAGCLEVLKYQLPGDGVPYAEEKIVVELLEGASPGDVAIEGDTLDRLFPLAGPQEDMANWYRVNVPKGFERSRILAYADMDSVVLSHYVGIRTLGRAPNDPCYQGAANCYGLAASQWNVKKARLTAAWEVRRSGVPIAILDSGVSTLHEEFVGNVSPSVDCTLSGSCTPDLGTSECGGHGTAVASVAAAHTNNLAGVAGAAWQAGIGSYKLAGALTDCEVPIDAFVAAVDRASRDGFKVLNISSFGPGFVLAEALAVSAAWDRGAFLVSIASGDEATSEKQYPGAYARVFAVAATTPTDTRVTGTGYGSWVNLGAPGENIVLADSFGGYSLGSGTSFAAPLVSGAASLLMADGLTNSQVENRLQTYGDSANWDPTRTDEKRLNAYRSLKPDQGCLRDVPIGAWVRQPSTEAVYFVAGFGLLRGIPRAAIVTSWDAWGSVVPLCKERMDEMSKFTDWGYRPGALVRKKGATAVYLITTDGNDRGVPEKRGITSAAVFDCYGWDWDAIIEDPDGVGMDLHPKGSNISSCNSSLRTFPNGSVIRSPGGAIYVVEGGNKRHVPSPDVYDSWFRTANSSIREWTQATSSEISAISTGLWWGFRPGWLARQSGSDDIWFISDRGTRARGERRLFTTLLAGIERGYEHSSFSAGVSSTIMGVHPVGLTLRDADEMP